MKMCYGILVFLVNMFGYLGVAFSYDTADTFIFPLKNYVDDYCLDWGGTYDQFPGKRHVADDRCVPDGTDVRAVANGRIKFTYDNPANNTVPHSWYGLIVMEHTLLNGNKVCSIYGHTKPVVVNFNGVQRKVKVGDEVSIGQKIGEIVNYPPSSEHIHFGIYNDYFQTEEGVGSNIATWMVGYVLSASWPGKYLDPVAFIENHKEIGKYEDGYHFNGTSQAFLDAYNQYDSRLGWPEDRGGSVFVHDWNSVWLQDFQGDMDSSYFGTDGEAALILNDSNCPTKAYLVKEYFWDYYKNQNGPESLGVPYSDEIVGKHANTNNLPGYDWDPIQPGDTIRVQKFRDANDPGCSATKDARKTLIWNEWIDTQRFPVGNYVINPSSDNPNYPQAGDQIYVIIDPLNSNTDKPWPLAGVTVPIGDDWFSKPGIYNFCMHNYDGSRKSGWNMTAIINEGNAQSSGDAVELPINPPVTEDYTINRTATSKDVDLDYPWLPIDETAFFSVNDGDDQVHSWIQFDDISKQVKIDWHCYNAENQIMQIGTSYAGENGYIHSWWRKSYYCTIEGRMSFGEWKVEIYIDDELVVVDKFDVSVYLSKPQNLSATLNEVEDEVTLSWSGVDFATSYRVYRNGIRIASDIISLYFIDDGVVTGATYAYKVVAVRGNRTSSFGDGVEVVIEGDILWPIINMINSNL